AMEGVASRQRELALSAMTTRDDLIKVAVQDTGVGFDPRDRDKLFDALYTTKPDGMGMGLAICKSIIRTHGGQIEAQRNAGPGATFAFTLPGRREPHEPGVVRGDRAREESEA